jgi:hypothetical protein
MKHAASESDVTLATSPPRAAYYVQSPSRDSQSSATSRATPVYNNTPLESPSTGRHSRVSSSAATRYSAFLRSSSSPRKRGKEWREVDDAIDEEEEELLPKVCVAAFWLSALVLVFAVVCLIVWAAALNYEPGVIVKVKYRIFPHFIISFHSHKFIYCVPTVQSLTVHNLHVGEGADGTGVPTKLVTLNCTLHIDVRNPSTMSGIHVSSSSSRLMYSEIPVANGQVINNNVLLRTPYFGQTHDHVRTSL